MMRKQWWWAGASVGLLVVVMVCLFDAGQGSRSALSNQSLPPAPDSRVVTNGRSGSSEKSRLAGQFEHYAGLGASLGKEPASLQGTRVDGHVAADSNGNLIVAVGIREMFDYFLSTLGEESLEAVKGRIAFYLKQHLPESAALQAWTLFDHYMEYRQALASLPQASSPQTGGSVASLRQVIDERAELRSSWLGEVASLAFFGPEEAYDNYTLAKMQVEQDKNLSEAERQQRLTQLKDALPADVQTMLKQTMGPTDVARQVATMRQEGDSEADIQVYREQELGPEAAARLQQLDQQRADWQQRYDDYRRQRDAIVDAGLDKSDQAQQITALRERLFSAAEQRRVAALDDIAAQKAASSAATGSQTTEQTNSPP
jgi:lipase chaperone LimK